MEEGSVAGSPKVTHGRDASATNDGLKEGDSVIDLTQKEGDNFVIDLSEKEGKHAEIDSRCDPHSIPEPTPITTCIVAAKPKAVPKLVSTSKALPWIKQEADSSGAMRTQLKFYSNPPRLVSEAFASTMPVKPHADVVASLEPSPHPLPEPTFIATCEVAAKSKSIPKLVYTSKSIPSTNQEADSGGALLTQLTFQSNPPRLVSESFASTAPLKPHADIRLTFFTPSSKSTSQGKQKKDKKKNNKELNICPTLVPIESCFRKSTPIQPGQKMTESVHCPAPTEFTSFSEPLPSSYTNFCQNCGVPVVAGGIPGVLGAGCAPHSISFSAPSPIAHHGPYPTTSTQPSPVSARPQPTPVNGHQTLSARRTVPNPVPSPTGHTTELGSNTSHVETSAPASTGETEHMEEDMKATEISSFPILSPSTTATTPRALDSCTHPAVAQIKESRQRARLHINKLGKRSGAYQTRRRNLDTLVRKLVSDVTGKPIDSVEDADIPRAVAELFHCDLKGFSWDKLCDQMGGMQPTPLHQGGSNTMGRRRTQAPQLPVGFPNSPVFF